MDTDNIYARWFGWIVLAGVGANLLLALPALFYPNALLTALDLPPNLEHPIWPSFASLLLLLLSAAYVPPAFDPNRYRPLAYLAVFARWCGVMFFLVRDTEYTLFGVFDLVFAVSESLTLGLFIFLTPKAVSVVTQELSPNVEIRA